MRMLSLLPLLLAARTPCEPMPAAVAPPGRDTLPRGRRSGGTRGGGFGRRPTRPGPPSRFGTRERKPGALARAATKRDRRRLRNLALTGA